MTKFYALYSDTEGDGYYDMPAVGLFTSREKAEEYAKNNVYWEDEDDVNRIWFGYCIEELEVIE